MKWIEFEEKQDWKDQKRHQTEESRDCCCWEWENKVRVKMEEWESWEIFEVFEVGKHSRGKGCQLVVIERWRTNEDENEGGKEREMEWERRQVVKTFKNTWGKGGKIVVKKGDGILMWRIVRMEWRRNEEGRKTVLIREDTRRKCGQTVVVEIECERGEENCSLFSIHFWSFSQKYIYCP